MFKISSAASALVVMIVVPSALLADSTWRIVAQADSDLVRVLNDGGANVERFDDAATAVSQAPHGSGVLVLADE